MPQARTGGQAGQTRRQTASPAKRPAKSEAQPTAKAAAQPAAKAAVPRESHAAFDPPTDRPDPVALLEEQGKSRIPELVPVRYGRMLASQFSYFRGAALPMAADLATTPDTGLTVQACGDAHLSNFGLYASPERKLLFDVNDFDETLPGPWEWDVKRLAASLEVAARGNGFARKDRRIIVQAAAAGYREVMRRLAATNNLDVWYTDVDIEGFRREFAGRLSTRQRKTLDKAFAKARGHDSKQALDKLCAVQDGKLRIMADPPLVVPLADLLPEQLDHIAMETELHTLTAEYAQTLQSDRRVPPEGFGVAGMARKVAGR